MPLNDLGEEIYVRPVTLRRFNVMPSPLGDVLFIVWNVHHWSKPRRYGRWQ
jgi:hypothetical protein